MSNNKVNISDLKPWKFNDITIEHEVGSFILKIICLKLIEGKYSNKDCITKDEIKKEINNAWVQLYTNPNNVDFG